MSTCKNCHRFQFCVELWFWYVSVFRQITQSTENVFRRVRVKWSSYGKHTDEQSTRCNVHNIHCRFFNMYSSGHNCDINNISYCSKLPGSSIYVILPTFYDSLFFHDCEVSSPVLWAVVAKILWNFLWLSNLQKYFTTDIQSHRVGSLNYNNTINM